MYVAEWRILGRAGWRLSQKQEDRSACFRMFLYDPLIRYDVKSKTLIVLGMDAPYQSRISKDSRQRYSTC